jgi:hypothetical protein
MDVNKWYTLVKENLILFTQNLGITIVLRGYSEMSHTCGGRMSIKYDAAKLWIILHKKHRHRLFLGSAAWN